MRKILIFLFLFFSVFTRLDAVNHWIVTQTGKIQAFIESPFDLRKPDDLLSLLEQENRRNEINDLYEDLVTRKAAIEKKWVEIKKNSNVGAKVTQEDVDCLAAQQLFSDLDLYNNIATNGSERKVVVTIPKDLNIDKTDKETSIPLCMNFTDFQRSESLVNKTNIAIKPEKSLIKKFLPVKSLDHFGNYIVMSLKENSTSWVHYNLASFYWRIKGEGDKAIDCLKLAIQFVTGNFQDIPLHNLAGVLHQSHHSKEAIQILNSAIQIAPKEPLHYFAMANIYAAMREFNKSVIFYEKVLEFDPSNKEAADHRHAVLCYYKLETAFTSFQTDHQNILLELHNYHSIQQQWLRLQERMMWERASFDYNYDPVHPELLDMPKRVQRCIKTTTGEKPVISCDFYEKTPDMGNLNLQNLFQIVENEKHKLSIDHPMNLKTDEFEYGGMKNVEDAKMVFPKFPTSMSTKGNQYFDITGWPTKEECLDWNLSMEDKDPLDLPVFLPPDNKGYQLRTSLSEYLNLPEGAQHDLPWYPPICEGEKINGEKFLVVNEKHFLETELKNTDYLRKELLKYVNDGNADEHEIGQRIISAMEKKTSPKWVLATLASLYWRVRGNTKRTLDCLDMAFQMAPKDHTDVVLVSLGSTMYQLGLKEQALKFATLAFKINYVEPSTNFLLALLHYENNNPLLAMYYLKSALRVEPGYYDGLAEKLLKIWACRIKLGTEPKLPIPGMNSKLALCPHAQAFNGEALFCDEKNSNCEKSDFQCFQTEKEIDFDAPTPEEAHEICKKKIAKNLGHQIMASLLAAEGSDLDSDRLDLEKIRSQEESDGFYYPHIHHHVHMGLSLGAEHPLKEFAKVGDFYVSLDINENPDNEQRLHIYDKYGTYTLSPSVCQYTNLISPFKYSQLWSFIKDNTLDIAPFVKYPITKNPKEFKPHCMQVLNANMPYGLNELTLKVLGLKLINPHDKELTELLQLISGNQKLNVRELGIKIAKALSEDEIHWQLFTASAIYWIIYGNTEQAMVCLRGAITKVPHSQLDIPLTFFSHLLGNLGLHKDALDIANLALSVNSNGVWNHFRVADIYIKVNGYEQAVPFLRASLQIDDKFDPARIRLKAVLCKLLFEDGYTHGSITAKIVDN